MAVQGDPIPNPPQHDPVIDNGPKGQAQPGKDTASGVSTGSGIGGVVERWAKSSGKLKGYDKGGGGSGGGGGNSSPTQSGPGGQNTGRFARSWMQWFLLLREKINVINALLVGLSKVTGQGFLVLFDGQWYTRAMEGPMSVEIQNPDGSAGNPIFTLANDEAAPGELESYGTDATGAKGWFKPALFESTGVLAGGTLSLGGGNTFNIAQAAVGWTDYSISAVQPTRDVQLVGPFAGLTTASLANLATYVGILMPGGSVVQQTSAFTATQQRDIAPLGVIVSDGVNLITVNNLPAVLRAGINQVQDLMAAIGAMNLSGNVVGPNGATLQLVKSAGKIFKQGSNFTNNEDDPHGLALAALTGPTFNYRLSDSTQFANTTVIDPNNYESPIGTLTAIPGANRWTTQRISVFTSNILRVQYGQFDYLSMGEAESKIATEAFVTEQNIAENGVLLCFLVVRDGTTDLTNPNDAKFIPASKFGGPVGTGGSTLTNTDSLPEGAVNLYFTDERAQDAVGTILVDTATINFTYDDVANTIKADAIGVAGGVHNSLTGLQGGIVGEYYHLTSAQYTQIGTMTAASTNAFFWRGDKVWSNELEGPFSARATVDTAVLGAELVTNGTFTGSAASWTLGAGWAYGTDNVICTVPTAGTLSQNISVTSGNLYLVSWSQQHSLANNGTVTPSIGAAIGLGVTITGTSAATQSQIIGALATGSLPLTFTVSGGTSGTITVDTVSTMQFTTTIPYTIELENVAGTTVIHAMAYASSSNVAYGINAGRSITSGGNNTFYGSNAGRGTTIGTQNVHIGASAGANATISSNNIFIGFQAGRDNTTGGPNVYIGAQAGAACNGGSNVCVGHQTGAAGTSATNNTFIGTSAGLVNTIGNNNVFVGFQAGVANTSGSNNSAIGEFALAFNTTGGLNSAIGRDSGLGNTTGANNTFLGYSAGRFQADGTTALALAVNSIYIGQQAKGFSNSDNNSIVIGSTAIGHGANTARWGNTSILNHFQSGSINLNQTSVADLGAGVFRMLNATTLPSVNPVGGATIYIEGGVVKARQSDGTITQMVVPGGFQPVDATLTALAGTNWALDSLAIGTGVDTVAQVTFGVNTFPAKASTGALVAKVITDFAFTILDDIDAGAVRTTINAQQGDPTLTALSALTGAGYVHATATNTFNMVTSIPQADVATLVADLAAKAPLDSPALTGIPTAPTASVGTNTTQLATTAFVIANAGGGGGSGTVTSVAATAPAAGFSITGSPITTSGTLVFTLTNDLAAVEGLGTTGLAVRSAADTWVTRSIVPAAGVTITDGDGIAGNPTVGHADTSSVGPLASDNSGVVVIQDINFTFDTFGHVLTATAGTVDLTTAFSSVFQPLDATLTALAGNNWALNSLPIGSGADTVAQIAFGINTFPARASTGNLVAKPITDFMIGLLDDIGAAAARTTLLAQASDATLTALAALTGAGYIKASATDTFAMVTTIPQADVTNLVTDLAGKQAQSGMLDSIVATGGWTLDTLLIGNAGDDVDLVTFGVNTFPAHASTGTLSAKPISDFSITTLNSINAAAWRTALAAANDGDVIHRAGSLAETATGLKTFSTGIDAADVKVTAGRLYGTALHNNAAGMAGTTNQFVGSGTYTPTGTIVANITTLTPNLFTYIRVGNVVSFSGVVTQSPTAASATTTFRLSLPIASALVNNDEASGVVYSGQTSSVGFVRADPATDTLLVTTVPSTTSALGLRITGQYLVL